MRNPLRTLGTVVTLVATLGLHPAPSAAEGGTVFDASVYVECSGCGHSQGTASICVTGAVDGQPMAGCAYPRRVLLGGNAQAVFEVDEGVGTDCVISGTALGTVSGAVSLVFFWQRLGAMVLISTVGDMNGSSTAAIVPTGPLGIPCGGPATFTMAGELAGT